MPTTKNSCSPITNPFPEQCTMAGFRRDFRPESRFPSKLAHLSESISIASFARRGKHSCHHNPLCFRVNYSWSDRLRHVRKCNSVLFASKLTLILCPFAAVHLQQLCEIRPIIWYPWPIRLFRMSAVNLASTLFWMSTANLAYTVILHI
jgi:hypothetical protein